MDVNGNFLRNLRERIEGVFVRHSSGRRAVSPVRELVTKMLVNFVDTITRINLCLFCYKTNQASVGGRPENFISTWIVRRFRNKFVRIQPWF